MAASIPVVPDQTLTNSTIEYLIRNSCPVGNDPMWKTVVESLRSDQKYILDMSQIRYERLEREYDSVTRYAVRKDEQAAQLQATITKLEQDNAKWRNKSLQPASQNKRLLQEVRSMNHYMVQRFAEPDQPAEDDAYTADVANGYE
jgi:septal ring factor EnvC (AmiA/AmiB activator)